MSATQSFLELSFARKRGVMAAQSCADAADRRDPHWTASAYAAFVAYAKLHPGKDFTCEDVRNAAAQTVTEPPDCRAWGAIAIRAKREGIVASNGFRCVSSSNNSPKVLWRSRYASPLPL